MQFLAGRFGPV